MSAPRGWSGRQQSEYPPYSRLFIVCEKTITESTMRDAFSTFGTIEDIKIPCDRNSGEPKGFVYIQFSKTSEAARALENMNITILPGFSKPLKIMVAANRSEIQSDDYDEEKFKRLFITVPQSANEQTLLKEFEIFGHVESIVIQRDKNGECKGFAYVKFRKFSEAADAFENCDWSFKAVFAIPKSQNKRRHETAFESNINNLASSLNPTTSLISMMNSRPNGFTKVNFICCPYLTQKNVEMLFDVIPGLIHFQFFVDLIRNFGKGVATYSNAISAAYAVEKLNKFEYPPGMKLFVKPNNNFNFEEHEHIFNHVPDTLQNLRSTITSAKQSASPDLAQLAEAIAEASKLIKTFTGDVDDMKVSDDHNLHYCSVKLPPPQPLADIDSPVAKRCFLVCKPKPPPTTVLRDIFCRFGNMINVYTLPGKTIGYARYAVADSADKAIDTLHGAEVCGVRLKVIEAEEEAPPKSRPRYD